MTAQEALQQAQARWGRDAAIYRRGGPDRRPGRRPVARLLHDSRARPDVGRRLRRCGRRAAAGSDEPQV